MKNWIINNYLLLIGGMVGAIAGYLYYTNWGCTNGCAITSSPINSTLYGTMMGSLLFSIIKNNKPKR